MSIPFTQFLMPDGRRVDESIDRPADVEEDARAVLRAGLVFEAEVLRTGQVSFECLRHVPNDDPVSIAHVICANGPPVLEAVDRLVRTAKANLPVAQ